MSNAAKKRRPSRLQTLNAETHHWMKLSFAPLGAAAIASFVTTYNGVVIITDWLAAAADNVEAIALMVSFVASGVSAALWLMTIRFLGLFATSRATAIGVFVLLLLIASTLVSSTYTSAIGLTQQSARALYLLDLSDTFASSATALRRRLSEMENAAAFIRPEADDACVKAEVERREGVVSGSSGAGPIASKLQTLCTRKSSIKTEVEETLRETQVLFTDFRALIGEIDVELLDRSRSLEERERRFFESASKLQALLEDLRAKDRMRSIRASYRAIGDAVASLEALRENLSRGQANALTEIIAAEQASATALERMIAQIEQESLPRAERARPVPPSRLVLRYAHEHVPQFALAMSLDAFGPLSALLFHAARMRRRRKNQLERL